MKFKIGDRIVVDVGTFKGVGGEIVDSLGLTSYGPETYSVVLDGTTAQINFNADELVHPFDYLMGGSSDQQDCGALLWPGNIQEKRVEVKCDCGGFRTFGSMSPENHSHWCSSINKVDAGLVIETEPLRGLADNGDYTFSIPSRLKI